MDVSRSLPAWFERRRKLLATSVLLIGCAVIGVELGRSVPREVEVRYDLGPEHAQVRAVQLGYAEIGGAVVRTARFSYPEGAPRSFRHRLELAPGAYGCTARVTREQGPEEEIVRRFEVPSEGVIRIDLFETAMALLGDRP
ncbi:MAG: hypothetical protein U0230_12805 [Polyangiales bacterium]